MTRRDLTNFFRFVYFEISHFNLTHKISCNLPSKQKLLFQGTESEQDSRNSSDPHSFVNHYANVNSTFRQSWKKHGKAVAVPEPPRGASGGGAGPSSISQNGSLARQRPPSGATSAHHHQPLQATTSTNPRGYSSFTESDQDGSSAVVSLNGTQIVMNNMARSRAPLPGFSSFV